MDWTDLGFIHDFFTLDKMPRVRDCIPFVVAKLQNYKTVIVISFLLVLRSLPWHCNVAMTLCRGRAIGGSANSPQRAHKVHPATKTSLLSHSLPQTLV
jgi:hypothetical protein